LLARARQRLAGTGIRRNPEESGGIRSKYRNSCPTGISAKKSCDSSKKQEFLRPPPKPCSCEKFLHKTQEKKKSSGILFFLFLSPQNRFLSNRKRQPRLKKDIANTYSKGNTDAYPKDIHKALTLMNEYEPLKLDAQVVPAQGTAFVTGGQGGKGRKGAKYLQDAKWNALSPEAKSKIIKARKKGAKGGEDNL
jgi:hypothetical protein